MVRKYVDFSKITNFYQEPEIERIAPGPTFDKDLSEDEVIFLLIFYFIIFIIFY